MTVLHGDKQHNMRTVNVLFVLTAFYFFYGYFEPYLNQIVGPMMRFYIIALSLFYLLHAHFRIKQNHLIRYFAIWFAFQCITL